MDEQTLIRAAQRGDLEAFNQLVLLYQDFLFRIALNILHDEDAAADAVQQALLSAFRSLRGFRGGSIRSWLGRIVVNASYDGLRRDARARSLPLEIFNQDDEEMEPAAWLADPGPTPEAQAETSELLEAIQTSLQDLPEQYRLALVLVDVEGLSYDEAAAALDVPKGTIKSRLARARNTLRTLLQRYPDLIPAAYTLDLPVPATV
ncbi:MAG: sigma-70 family RNA polymerase sigma factor [Thioalkalivibrio sp.]|nr:sigma-70 family RNA polymerase sigma factor [Thioalkalivibrio sp.]